MMRDLIVGLLVGAAIVLPFGLVPHVPACQTEDQDTTCVWDAQRRGNGEGRSFLVIDGQVYYLS